MGDGGNTVVIEAVMTDITNSTDDIADENNDVKAT